VWGLLLGIIIHIGERVKNQLIGMNRADPPQGREWMIAGRREGGGGMIIIFIVLFHTYLMRFLSASQGTGKS
jgi:hypothetical protein